MLPDNSLARCSSVIKSLVFVVCLSEHLNENLAATYFQVVGVTELQWCGQVLKLEFQ